MARRSRWVDLKLRTRGKVAVRRRVRNRASADAGNDLNQLDNSSPEVESTSTDGPAEPKFLAVDFFCGAGGTTRGLIDAQGYVMAGVDKEPRCRDTYVENNANRTLDRAKPTYLQLDIFPQTEAYPDGQQDQLFEKLDAMIEKHRKAAPNVPLLFAICAPCQPFTTLARKEMSTARIERRKRDSKLLTEAVAFVKRYKPDMVLSENVAGIGDIWSEFEQTLKDAGYATGTRRVCASKFGVPQYRKRSILIALRRPENADDAAADLAEETLHVPDHDPETAEVSVESVLKRFPRLDAGANDLSIPNHRARSLSDLNKLRLSFAKPGESNAYMATTPEGDLSLGCHRRVNERLDDRCFTDVYTRMRPDRPSPTITTRCHSISNGRFGHYDVTQIRGISLREAAALQSFPDEYVFHPAGMIEPVARMIGNAVPPKLARFFARYLVTSLEGDRPAA